MDDASDMQMVANFMDAVFLLPDMDRVWKSSVSQSASVEYLLM